MNNKGADQIVQMHRLVCTFVVRIQQSGFLMMRPNYKAIPKIDHYDNDIETDLDFWNRLRRETTLS